MRSQTKQTRAKIILCSNKIIKALYARKVAQICINISPLISFSILRFSQINKIMEWLSKHFIVQPQHNDNNCNLKKIY